MHWLIRWLFQHLAIGIAATAISIAFALLLDVVIESGWAWERFALIFLALAVFLLLTALSTPGVQLPGVYGAGWDARTAYIETMAREGSGAFSDARPPTGGLSALVAILPPFVAALVIVSAYL